MEERAIRRDGLIPPWSAGNPAPVLIATEWVTLFACYLSEPEVRGGAEVQVAEFTQCTSVRFGFPNDEVLHGHPLWGHGLEYYALHEIRHSSWLAALDAIERVHPRSGDAGFGQTHFLLAFHDNTLEAIADGVRAIRTAPSMRAAVSAMTEEIDRS